MDYDKWWLLPLQSTTDCGSETAQLYGLANALWFMLSLSIHLLSESVLNLLISEIFHPDFDLAELPAHVYLCSVHNISIECSWLHLRLNLGDNAVLVFEKGKNEGIYNPDDPQH